MCLCGPQHITGIQQIPVPYYHHCATGSSELFKNKKRVGDRTSEGKQLLNGLHSIIKRSPSTLKIYLCLMQRKGGLF